MNGIAYYVNEVLSMTFPSGKLLEQTSNHCIITLPNLTRDAINGLWSQLILRLTANKLINGVLDMPLIYKSDHAIMWAKDYQIFCFAGSMTEIRHLLTEGRPSPPHATTLAIGGPPGSGKTLLIRKLQESTVGNRVRRYVAYTTRPMRKHESEGVDYYFVNPKKISLYREDPRYTGFTEARGFWYWSEPLSFFKSRWSIPDAIHVFAVTQVHEFLAKRNLASDLKWIWLDASQGTLRHRLERRGDENIDQSLAQSERLTKQDRTGLVDLQLDTENVDMEISLSRLLNLIKK